MEKYRVLIDYGSCEGMKFWDKNGFDNIDEAVRQAQENSYGSKFYIVKIINWKAIANTD
jgi:hypothetical protein